MAHVDYDPAAPIRDADFRNERPTVSTASLTGTGLAQHRLDAELLRADEADLLEQRTVLPFDDAEDYPNTRVRQAVDV